MSNVSDMTDGRRAAWEALHVASERLGWFVGWPAFRAAPRGALVAIYLRPFEQQKLGKRSRE